MPKSIKKAKTQGRVGKIIYNKKNKGNNFLYINNNQNTINKTINTRYSLNHNKKINRISPLNNMNNSQNFKSICISKENNFHSLKNLKIDNVQKSLKKYLLEDEYIKMIPMNKENNNNSLEKEQLKTMKDSRNKKFIKNHFKNPFNGANTNLHNINQNIYRIKKIIPLNISQKSQLRSFNSCFPYKINKNALNNFTNEQILTTINNNHDNKKIDMLNNFKKNLNLTKKKIRNISDKKYNNEKSINKKDEISYNILPEQCKKNNIDFITTDSLSKKIDPGDKKGKQLKKWCRHYKLLFVSESIVSQLPKLGGQFYSRWGKFPFVIKTNEQVKNKVDEQLASVKFQLKKVMCLAVAVANVDMTEDQIRQNLNLTINFLVSLLKKGWNNIKSLYIKTTMGKPVSLF